MRMCNDLITYTFKYEDAVSKECHLKFEPRLIWQHMDMVWEQLYEDL